MKNLIVLFPLLIITQLAFAQNSKREQIKAEHIAFMTEELSLTGEEAEKFWPIYNEYSQKNIALKKEIRSLKKELLTAIEENNSKVPQLFETILTKEEEEIALKRTYAEKFKSALPEEKVYKVFIADEKFKRYLLKKLKSR